MKKRVKILTTIASLCLAVALMAFGVYAAAQQKMTVGSTVSFTAQVAVTWGWEVEGGTLENKVSGTKQVAAIDPEATFDPSDENTNALPETVQFANAANNTITYTFTCKNDGADAIKVVVVHTPVVATANLEVDYHDLAWNGEHTVAKGDTLTLSVTFTWLGLYKFTI